MYTIWSPNYLASVCMFCYPIRTTVKNLGLARTNDVLIVYLYVIRNFYLMLSIDLS